MKKIFYLASIAALAFSSCAKDETTEVALDTVGGGKIVAEMSGNADTRAYLDANHKFNWQDGDKLAVYNTAEHPMFNSAYSWKNGYTQGVFEGEKKFNADEAYLAVYPRFSTSLITTGDLANMWAYGYLPYGPRYSATPSGYYLKLDANDKATGVKLSIPAEQKYMPGSFYQDIVPAMSTTFNVLESGDAEIKMQPVADYLFVNIKATDPIETLTLRMYDRDATDWLDIAGTGNPTAYLLDGNVRYYLSESEMDEKAITLVTNDYAADVTCHEPQTYVFVIPGNILGTVELAKNNAATGKKGIEAHIWVNDKTSTTDADFVATSHDKTAFATGTQLVSNSQMNGYYSQNGTLITQDDITIVRGAETDQTKLDPQGTLAAKNMELENKYFWVNPQVKVNGVKVRDSFVYNPSNADIIENEAELLRYLSLYENGTAADKRDAYICDNHTFDFSEAHMKQLSSELKSNGAYTEFQPYIDAYLNGSFPTITKYEHVFNGNNAVISGIVEPLKGMGGIFGEIKGTIKDVTFDGIVAAEMDAEAPKGKMYPGVILGSVNGGTISKVAVKNAEGMAIFGKANSTVLSKVAIEGVEDLNFIVVDMDLLTSNGVNNYTKTWSAWSGVKKAVFGTLDASGQEFVYLPEGADYAKLAWYVSTADATLAAGINHIVAGKNNFVAKPANQADTNAVSVMIGETSIWTGDKIAPTYTLYTAGVVASNNAKKDYKYIECAEQLAGWPVSTNARLFTDMDMSYAVNSWTAPASAGVLEGNGATIKGIKMNTAGVTTFRGSYVAPFAAKQIYNLNVDGVSIKITTAAGEVVPQFIGGLAKDANRVENVVVKGLSITGDGASNNNERYDDELPSYIGWLVANANNITVKKSNVEGENKIAGIAAMVGRLEITENNSAKFEDATASVTTPQEQLANFWDFNGGNYDQSKHGNFAATAVAFVKNTSGAAKSIEFTGSTGKPVFLYNNDADSDINVLYDDSKVILKKGDKQYK